MLFVNVSISTFLLYLYCCRYAPGAISLISTCLNPKFDSNKRPDLRDGSFLFAKIGAVMRGKRRFFATISVLGVLLIALVPLFTSPVFSKTDENNKIEAYLASKMPFESLSSTAPTIEKPDWYFDTIIYYSVAQNGSTSDLGTFATLANETLNDARGWARLGVRFVKVDSGGSFRLVLANASLLPSYSSGCSVDWSCSVGNTVIINDSRWTGASSAWNAAGGTLRDYRHMVVNHEVGHWLGHGHESCPASGASAPVMQQQSIDLMGCTFNPWPLESELWTTRF